MSKLVTIYCEGTAGSHDYDIINKIIDGLDARIEPIGGKRGAGSAIQVHENLIVKSDFYLFFRDRDFDQPIPATPRLTTDGKYTHFSYRITIENYLIHPEICFNFCRDKGLSGNFKISSVEDMNAVFIKAAERIKNYQAVRHTLGFLRSDKASFQTTWTGGSGCLPEDLGIGYCINQAMKSVDVAKSHTGGWNIDFFQEKCAEFLQSFSDDFFQRHDYLIWFQGKDFAASLMTFLPGFPLKGYYKYAKSDFQFMKFPDLVELYGIINAKQ